MEELKKYFKYLSLGCSISGLILAIIFLVVILHIAHTIHSTAQQSMWIGLLFEFLGL